MFMAVAVQRGFENNPNKMIMTGKIHIRNCLISRLIMTVKFISLFRLQHWILSVIAISHVIYFSFVI